MKITILQGAFLPVPPALGGAVEKRWFRVAQEFVRLGCQVTHISRSFEGFPDEEVIEGVQHRRVRGYSTASSSLGIKWRDLLYSRRAVRLIPADTDIVVTNTFFGPLLVRRRLKSRVYVDVARTPKGQMKLYGKAARLRANSTPVADAIRAELPESEHGRVVVIPNPLPFLAAEDAPPFENTSGLLYCGRVHPEKGIQLLIEALKLMSNPPALRVIGPWRTEHGGGGTAFYDSLKEAARDLPVTFVEPIFSIEELNQEYREASIFVYPSLAEKGETFGLAPLESMAWGCIPLVSNLDCFKDFIVDGKNGRIFDHRAADSAQQLADRILEIFTDRPRAELMSEAATEVRSTHSPHAIAEQFLSDFRRIVEKNR